jgi:hypothetical protein
MPALQARPDRRAQGREDRRHREPRRPKLAGNATPLFAKNIANFLDLMIQKDW